MGNQKWCIAKRALCMSCHQSGGPIFSLSPWAETSSNTQIANELIAHGARGLERLIYPLVRLDRATGQAALLEAYQTLWGPMCEGASRDASIRCRAGLLELMLEKRFFGTPKVLTDSEVLSPNIFCRSRVSVFSNTGPMAFKCRTRTCLIDARFFSTHRPPYVRKPILCGPAPQRPWSRPMKSLVLSKV